MPPLLPAVHHAASCLLPATMLALNSRTLHANLHHADTVLAAVAPRPPPKAVRDAVSGGGGQEEDEDEDPLRLRLPANAPAWKRNTVRFLRQRLHVPEAALALLLRVSLRAWLALAAWMAGARLAARWELGPLYIIATILLLMLLNLGQRREGQWRCAVWLQLARAGAAMLDGQPSACLWLLCNFNACCCHTAECCGALPALAALANRGHPLLPFRLLALDAVHTRCSTLACGGYPAK